MLMNRIIVALILAPILLSLTLLGDMYSFIAVELSILIMMNEFYSMIERNVEVSKFSGLVLGSIIPAIHFFVPQELKPSVMGLAFTFSIMFFIIKRVMYGNVKRAISGISYTLLGIFYISFLFSHSLAIISYGGETTIFGLIIDKGKAWVILSFIISFGSDSSAFFIGKSFGKTKLAPKISEKKSVEGLLGSMLFGLVLGIFISYNKILVSSYTQGIILGVIGATLAQLGDLGASVFKRELGVKDYSDLLMSHGGLLDRCDSALFVIPFVWYFMQFMPNI